MLEEKLFRKVKTAKQHTKKMLRNLKEHNDTFNLEPIHLQYERPTKQIQGKQSESQKAVSLPKPIT